MEIKELDLPERRAIIAAAKVITKFRLASVTNDYGIHSNNLYSFLNGVGNGIGVKSQFQVMRNYGFGSDGRLLDYLHSWSVDDVDSIAHVWTCVSHEEGIDCITLRRAMVVNSSREFVGIHLELSSASGAKPRRIIVTNNDLEVDEDGFARSIVGIFENLNSHVRIEEGAEIFITRSEAVEAWRWRHCRNGGRVTPYRVPPKTAMLSYEYEIESTQEKAESATALIEKMLPRFEKLSQDVARLKGIKQSSWDLSLIGRSKKFLGGV